MIPIDKIIRILYYFGPQTYNDMVIQGFDYEEKHLDEFVDKGVIEKHGQFYCLKNQKINKF